MPIANALPKWAAHGYVQTAMTVLMIMILMGVIVGHINNYPCIPGRQSTLWFFLYGSAVTVRVLPLLSLMVGMIVALMSVRHRVLTADPPEVGAQRPNSRLSQQNV